MNKAQKITLILPYIALPNKNHYLNLRVDRDFRDYKLPSSLPFMDARSFPPNPNLYTFQDARKQPSEGAGYIESPKDQ